MFFGGSVLAIAVLYWMQDLLIPLALAVLLAFLFKPMVSRFVRWHVPKLLASLMATILVTVLLLGLMTLVSSQVYDLSSKIPNYRDTLTPKLHSMRDTAGRVLGRIKDVKSELATTQPKPTGLVTIPVSSSSTADTGLDVMMSMASTFLTPLLSPLTRTGVVLILMFFLLLDADIVTRRLTWVTEHWRLGVPLDVVDEAVARTGRYLRMQLFVNLTYGAIIALVLWLIGIPNPLLWGILSCILRYVPFIGPWIAASMPVALSIAVFPGWAQCCYVLILYACIEAVTYGLAEPLLFGHSTGVSSIGVVCATFFWGWLWGPVGLILAMPMTVCLVVIGRHIPILRTLSVLLSSDAIEPGGEHAMAESAKPRAVTSYLLRMR
jgi:predicted PurR-regulated permease PerM